MEVYNKAVRKIVRWITPTGKVYQEYSADDERTLNIDYLMQDRGGNNPAVKITIEKRDGSKLEYLKRD